MILTLAAALALATAAAAELPALIPREVLFGNPVRELPAISPDGSKLAYLAPDEKGVLQVWVGPLDPEAARPLTRDPHRGVQTYFWAADSRPHAFSGRSRTKPSLDVVSGLHSDTQRLERTDGARWAVDQGIADPNRLAVMGGSGGTP
jgi:dipeptidyl aminopeptidase/acylaminoacyl peptidase